MQLSTLHLQSQKCSWPWPPLNADPPSHVDEGVWVLVASHKKTFLDMAYSHQDCFVCLNIPVVLACQGDN